MKTLSCNVNLFLDMNANETMDEALERLIRIIKDIGLQSYYYDVEVLDEDGNPIETKAME